MSETHDFDAVCVGAHPDDVEIGMGGTIAGLVRAGKKVALVDLTNGEPTPHGTVEIRIRESLRSASILGAKRITLDMPNRFLFDSVEARMELAEVLRELRPRMLFIPFAADAHPDHMAASDIALAARFYSKLTKTAMCHEPFFPPRVFRYMAVHQRIVAEPSFVVDITEDLPTKLLALAAYESQFTLNDKNVGLIEFVESTAKMWGAQARVGAGEPFFALEPVALATPLDVL